jgi:hypothetical protein
MTEASATKGTTRLAIAASSQDLTTRHLPPLSWQTGQVSESLTKLRDYAVGSVMESIVWYQNSKRPKRRAGRALRFLAIVLGSLAGMIPVLAQLLTRDGHTYLNPLWSAIAIAMAATLVLVDKFYGCTSAWVRYLLAELELQELQKSFTFEWESARLTAQHPEPTLEQAVAMLLSCRKFLLAAHGVVRDETQKWAAEFQSLLRDLEEASKAAAQARAHPGAIHVTVTNGPDSTGGWQLTVDENMPRSASGRDCAVGDVQPGIRIVRASGQLKGKAAHAQLPVQVTAGGITSVELTLV